MKTPDVRQAPRRKRVSSEADKWVFCIFFLLGACAIVGLKLLGLQQWIVTFVPVAILLAYGIGTLALKRFQLREDQTGDNCYYLGFLYTLVSLAFALYQFQTAKSGTEAIITSFGIALLTTITGLFLRVFINQFRQDTVEIEREARQELSEAASRLRAELDTIVVELNSFRRSVQQSVQEAVEEATLRSQQAIEANTQSVEQLSEISSKVIASLDTLTGRIAEIEVPSGLITDRLAPVLEELAAATQAVTDRTKGDEKTVRQVARAVDKGLKAASSWEAQLERMSAKAGTLLAAADEVADLPQRVAHGLQGIEQALAEQSQLFQEVHSAAAISATQSEEAFGRIAQAATETLELVKRHNEALEQEFRLAAQNTAKVEASLTSIVDTLAAGLEGDSATAPPNRPHAATGAS